MRCLNDALPHLDPPGARVEIPFEGTRLVGVFRAPRGEGPFPAVLMLPGLDSTKEEFRSTEKTFLDRGASRPSAWTGRARARRSTTSRSAATGRLRDRPLSTRSVPCRTSTRTGSAVWGVCLGGYYAPRVAAAVGDRVKACVALAGPYNFGECWDQLPPLTRKAFQVRSKARDDDEARAQRVDPQHVRSDVADHSAPTLVVGRQARPAHPVAAGCADGRGVRDAELLMLEDGNHGCMNVWPKHRPYTADWVAAKLGPG